MSSTSRQLARTGAITSILIGVYLVVLRAALAGGQDVPDEGVMNVAWSALMLAPAAIATVGWRRDAAPLLIGAAIGCGLLAILSVAALPFVVPLIVLLVAAIRGRWSLAGTLGAVVSTGLFAAAWLTLLLWPAERCIETATSKTCGHIATTTDALLSLGLIVVAVAVALVATRTPPPIIAGAGHPEDARPPGQ